MSKEIELLAEMLKEARRVTFFGGAGVSTESGIPDFRGAKGLFMKQREIKPEVIVSRSFFMREPAVFYDFYVKNLLYEDALPNAAHLALSQLERMGKLTAVITQNIDGLHQKAGSQKVLELHGSAHKNHCMDCEKPYDLKELLSRLPLPTCDCGGLIKPDVVLYEEALDQAVLDEAVHKIQGSDLLIVGGTSLQVYPAAGLARLCPGHLVLINKSPTPIDKEVDLVIREPIGATLHAALMRLN